MRDQLIQECKTIQQNCTYTAEAHHIIADDSKYLSQVFQVIPAIGAALLGTLVVGEVVPKWVGWLSVISAVIAAVGSVLDPHKTYYEHLNAAKHFTALKHEARSLRNAFSFGLSDEDLENRVRSLGDAYGQLIRFVPPTTKEAFEKAQERIKSGVHDPDE